MNHKLGISALVISLLLSGQLSAAEVATLLQSSGTVTITMAGANNSVAAVVNQELPNGTKITTGADGTASLKLPDGTVVDINNNSEMMISPYSRSGNVKQSILLFLGTIWSKVTKSFDGKISYVVNTPNAVAGVRGTEFGVTVADDGAARVQVRAGIVGVGLEEEVLNKNVTANQQIVGDDRGVGKVGKFADDGTKDDWEAARSRNLQKNGKKLGNNLQAKLKARTAKIDKINQQLKSANETKARLSKAAKMGDKEAALKLKMLQNQINDLQDQKAALADQAQSQFALYNHYLALANDPAFNMVDADTLKANAESLYKIKKQFDAMISYGTDLSMESMDKMLDEYSNGARGTLKEDDGSAAEALFTTTPDVLK